MDDTAARDTSGESHGEPVSEASHYGFPAVLGHEVVAVSCVARDDWESAEPGHISVIRRRDGGTETRRVPDDRLYVWARAGRVTFAAKDGEMVHLTLLSEHEHEGLPLGAPWPRTHSESKASNIVHGAVDDLKNVVTFPYSFPRMMRTSGERNERLNGLVAWCEREMPHIHVLRGWPRGAEGPDEHQAPALPHKGLIGHDGWLAGTVGVESESGGPTGPAASDSTRPPS